MKFGRMKERVVDIDASWIVRDRSLNFESSGPTLKSLQGGDNVPDFVPLLLVVVDTPARGYYQFFRAVALAMSSALASLSISRGGCTRGGCIARSRYSARVSAIHVQSSDRLTLS